MIDPAQLACGPAPGLVVRKVFARDPGFSASPVFSQSRWIGDDLLVQDSAISSKRLIATTSSWRINVRARFLLIPRRTES